ncbi:N-ethylmaleimide reductase [Lentzea xinjiangensis]|uniref:N-ethylmaleimide reductase n=1 Tax=Lentzea xinjiangensis TaxID=402600 RepID=A0A1H9PDS8_9PSEU|nr:alkene reductase [Lentzea xinjiangensis]SER46386.1 N-ethylmaleimide reductase [Lentzea xinjiangensis]
MSDINAFSPLRVGATTIANRLAMAPMTRSRATEDGLATASIAEYYRQRAGAGLIVTEATQISLRGKAYPTTPGIGTLAQAQSWQQVTDAVHEAGGTIHLQLFHGGRTGHPSMRGGLDGHAPSAVAAPGQTFTPDGMKDHPAPAAMTAEEIQETIREFAVASALAVSAGFDGVQLHAANGYLPQQFLCRDTNLRTDEWGGSTENRIRFIVETVRAMAGAAGADRTSLRISPASTIQGINEHNTEELYEAMLGELAGDGLAFLDVSETPGHRDLTAMLRKSWPGVLVLNPHRVAEPEAPHDRVADGLAAGADVVALGAAWLANPDLAERIARRGPYNEADSSTFYGGTDQGYLDYPLLAA